MKKRLVISTVITGVLVSGLASASTCWELFSNANEGNLQGQRYAQSAADHFARMSYQARTKVPATVSCETGVRAGMDAVQSARYFRYSRANWLEAAAVCEGADAETARVEAETNAGGFNTQAEFIVNMDNMLRARCRARPLMPLLNSDDNYN